MLDAIISRAEALREMDTGRVFSIRFYTSNVKLETGGKRIDIEPAVLNELGTGGATATDQKGIGETEYSSLRGPPHSKIRIRSCIA